MKQILVSKNLFVLLLTDLILLAGSYYCSYLVRFEAHIPAREWLTVKNTILPIIACKMIVFYLFNLYRGMWRYTSIVDLVNVVKATLVSSGIIVAIILFFHRFQGFSRGVFVIDALFTLLFIGGIRLFIRLYFTNTTTFFPLFKNEMIQRARLLIVGAGDAGEKMLREIRDNAHLKYIVVGFVDDAFGKIGKLIHGIPVLGRIEDIGNICNEHKIDEILIAIPSANRKCMRQIVDRCEETGLKFKTIPGLGELIDGRVSIKAIRDVSYHDLLGREGVQIDQEAVSKYLKDRRVLITGPAGSIGSELCRQVSRFNPELMVLLDVSESSLYQVDMELRERFSCLKFVPVLGNIQHKSFLQEVFKQYRPQVVFHAAAYKHVPLLEINPWEGVYNNIVGTKTLMEVAHDYEVSRFVLVSTDKAVRPTNVMGACKRVTEIIMHAYCQGGWETKFMAVRFGNVIGSAGSVVPIFKKQIQMGGPVTVTHPEITRYFMTVPEAAQLILQAMSMGQGGEIFVLDMGIPIKIADMARDLIRLSGFDPDRDIEIKYIPLRPGEKLYEELITEGEGITRTGHEKILVLRSNEEAESSPEKYARPVESPVGGPHSGIPQGKHFTPVRSTGPTGQAGQAKLKAERGGQEEGKNEYESEGRAQWLDRKVDELVELASAHDARGIKKKLKEIVPEYEPQETESVMG